MQNKASEPNQQRSKASANSLSGLSDGKAAFKFEDNRAERFAQQKKNAMKRNAAPVQKISDHIKQKTPDRNVSDANAVIQQKVNLSATQYQARLAPAGTLTVAQFLDYLKFVIKDDLLMARGYADNLRDAVGPPVPARAAFPGGAGAAAGEVGALAAFDAAIGAAVVAATAAELAAAVPAAAPAIVAAAGVTMGTCITIADELVTLVNSINTYATTAHATYGDPVAIAAAMPAAAAAAALPVVAAPAAGGGALAAAPAIPAPPPVVFPTPAVLNAASATAGAETVVAAGGAAPAGGAGVPQQIAIPNAQTRYAAQPAAGGYAHTNLRPSWATAYASAGAIAAGVNARAAAAAAGLSMAARNTADRGARVAFADNAAPAIAWNTEADAQTQFGAAAGATLLAAPTTAPRTAAAQVKQLTWDQAREFLPRPLLNLLFDVKSQLVAGGGVIDERTPFEQSVNTTTPNEPGTLRSWHEDSAGVLPGNGVAGIGGAAAPAAVPAGATALHAHYGATSGAGAGAGAGAAVAPLGFAEYTGAGTGNIHNIKVVSDYINNRVYLTLSHYQYWAILNTAAGATEFIEGGSQNLVTATQTIDQHARVIAEVALAGAAAPSPYVIMNPWIEILVP